MSEDVYVLDVCPECKGEGLNESDKVCEACEGTGMALYVEEVPGLGDVTCTPRS